MVVNKPAVLLYCHEPDVDYLKEICAGIEEEGVLFQILNREDDMDSLAYQAAKDSMLGVGIGIDGRRIAMQMNHVSKGKNIFELHAPAFWLCRNLGANSARAIKKMPFKPVY